MLKRKKLALIDGYSVFYENLIDKIITFISPTRDEKILDFGCGIGLIGYRLENFSRLVVGIDSELNLIDHKQNKMKEKFQLQKMPLPFENNYFDKILCFHVLEHLSFKEQIPILKEFKRVLKPSGSLYVGVPIFEQLSKIIWIVRKVISKNHQIVDHFGSVVHKRQYTRKQLLYELHCFNFFEVEKIKNIVISNAFYSILGDILLKIPAVFDIFYKFKNIP